MLITALIKQLEEIKQNHGEIEVYDGYFEEEIYLDVNIREEYRDGKKEITKYATISEV